MAFLTIGFPDGTMLKYDAQAHVAYFRVREGRVAKTEERAPNIIVDLDAKGNLIGVEIISPRHFRHEATLILRKISREHDVPTLGRLGSKLVTGLYQLA